MTANQYAKKNGFTSARKIAPWHGYACYEAIYGDAEKDVNSVPNIGYPQIILERGGVFRFANLDETMRYMEATVNDE